MSIEELQKQVQTFGLIRVTDAESLNRAGELVRSIKEFLRRVADLFDPIDTAQIAARRVTIAQRKLLEDGPMALDKAQRAEMGAYEEGERKKVQDAEVAAAKERQRLEDDARLKAALAAEAVGDVQTAARILDAPKPPLPVTVPLVVRPTPTKTDGFAFKTNYGAEIEDLKALVAAVAAGAAPLEYVLPNLTTLNQAARTLKEQLLIPGVRLVKNRTAITS